MRTSVHSGQLQASVKLVYWYVLCSLPHVLLSHMTGSMKPYVACYNPWNDVIPVCAGSCMQKDGCTSNGRQQPGRELLLLLLLL
jgi:hypothetical protein